VKIPQVLPVAAIRRLGNQKLLDLLRSQAFCPFINFVEARP
jgi:hypothetical protein